MSVKDAPFPLDSINPFVQQLPGLIDPDPQVGMSKLDEAVKAAYDKNIDQMIDWGISNADKFLKYASGLMKWIPAENQDATEIYYTLCMFYFVLDQEPVLGFQTKISPDSIDKPLTTLSNWITMFAIRMGDFMDTEASLTKQSLATFEKQGKFNMHEAQYPPGGFKTFNQLFSRHLLPGARPIDGAHNNNIITFPADSKFDGPVLDVDGDSMVHIKKVPWPVHALLRGSAYEKDFAGGQWMHAFLGPTDYHRQHAPVSGQILEAKVIQGLAYLEVTVEPSPGEKGRKTLVPHRTWNRHKIQPPPVPPSHSTYSSMEAPDTAGYQFIQTRGCIIIDNPTVGKVAVLPIGMAYVSSIKLSVQDIHRSNGPGLPSVVEKGDEISCFQFGGSDIVLVFQKDPGVDLSHLRDQHHYNYGQKLGELSKTRPL